MRLIDADALTKALADLWYDGKITITGVAVADLIDNAPTVDTERHGKWEIWSSPFSDDGAIDMIKCSECGYAPVWDSKEGRPNYCPNCGAKMDKE